MSKGGTLPCLEKNYTQVLIRNIKHASKTNKMS